MKPTLVPDEAAKMKQVHWAITRLKERLGKALEGNMANICVFALAEVFYTVLATKPDPLGNAQQLLTQIHEHRISMQQKAQTEKSLIVTP